MTQLVATNSRRSILTGTVATLSAAGMLALLDRPASAAGTSAKAGNSAQDVQLLNAALGLEDEVSRHIKSELRASCCPRKF